MDLHRLKSKPASARATWDNLSWYSPFFPARPEPDLHWQNWLSDSGSLTRRLKEVSDGRFRVELLSQRLCRPALNEAALLGLAPDQHAVIRQVILHGAGQPWVFARTVMPLATLAQGNDYLLRLGNRSLGSVLFNSPHIHRAGLEICQPDPAFITPFHWGRRSLFQIRRQPILVCELFLPPFARDLQLAV